MGRALAQAALHHGLEVVVLSGPVDLDYPSEVELHRVVSTNEMLEAALKLFPDCDAVIGAAAPCDYRPRRFSETKLAKADFSGILELEETPDILAALGRIKRPDQTIVAFALETHDAKNRAVEKLQRKNADFIVLNGPTAIDSEETEIEILSREGTVVFSGRGPKTRIAGSIIETLPLTNTRQAPPLTGNSAPRKYFH